MNDTDYEEDVKLDFVCCTGFRVRWTQSPKYGGYLSMLGLCESLRIAALTSANGIRHHFGLIATVQ